MNVVVFGMLFSSFVLLSLNYYGQNKTIEISSFAFAASFCATFTIIVTFLDSVRRMNVIMARIPILKKSEKFFNALFGMYLAFLV